MLRDAAKDIDPKEAEKAAGRDAERSRARTFRAVAEEYMDLPSPKKKNTPQAKLPRKELSGGPELQRKLDVDILPVIGDMPVDQIDKADIRALFRVKAAKSPVAANRMLDLVGGILSFAMKEDYVETNVATAVDFSPEVSRDRVLSDVEVKLFWDTLDNGVDLAPATRACLKFLLVTGQRRSEAAEAPWTEFNYAKSQWTIPARRAKNGRKHIVHISQLAWDLLADMAEDNNGEYVFLGVMGDKSLSPYTVSQGMKKALPKMKLPGGRATPQDLRRTMDTMMNEDLEIEPHVVDAILNHTGAAKSGVAFITGHHI
jgi:integrase